MNKTETLKATKTASLWRGFKKGMYLTEKVICSRLEEMPEHS